MIGCSLAEPGVGFVLTDCIISYAGKSDRKRINIKGLVSKDLVCIEFPYFYIYGGEYLSEDDLKDLIKIISYLNDTELDNIIKYWGKKME